LSEVDSGDSMAGCSAMRWRQETRASTDQQQKDETEQHAHIRAGFMQLPQNLFFASVTILVE
jgi:hypothetical protein